MNVKRNEIGFIMGIAVIAVIVLAFVGYNIYRYPAMFRSLSDDSLSDSDVEELREEILSQPDVNVLVAYFSNTGNTEEVAQVIAEYTGGTLAEIQRAEEYGDLQEEAEAEILNGVHPEITVSVDSIEGYDTIFVGYLNWNADLPMPLYTFLEEYDFGGKTIIPFTAHGGSGFSRTIQTIADLQPNTTVISDGLSISRNSVSGAASEVADWVNGLDLT